MHWNTGDNRKKRGWGIMEIPKTVKIAGIIYKVEEVEDLAAIQGIIGRLLEDKAIISLEKSLSKERKEQVFVHEVLHGIFREAGYNSQDEDLINRVAIVLHQVLKDNDFFTRNKKIVLNGSVNCPDCGADWSGGEICPHVHGPLEVTGGKEASIQVLEQPTTKWGVPTHILKPSPLLNPYPIEGLLAKDPTNWGKSIREIMDEGGFAKCPACSTIWKNPENACDCPTAPELFEKSNVESEGAK